MIRVSVKHEYVMMFNVDINNAVVLVKYQSSIQSG